MQIITGNILILQFSQMLIRSIWLMMFRVIGIEALFKILENISVLFGYSIMLDFSF